MAGEAPEAPADLLDEANGITIQNIGVTEQLKNKMMTELAKDRLGRLTQRVKLVQFVLRMELPKFFQVPSHVELCHGLHETPDWV